MKTCPNCRCQAEEEALFCPVCGNGLDVTPPPRPVYTEEPHYFSPEPEVNPYDHTEDYSAEDIQDHKLLCMLAYLLDFIGIIIALLAAKESPYTAFHVRQSMRFIIVEILLGLATAVLCWTFIVPILGAAALVTLLVIKFCCFCQVCKGLAKEAPIIRSIKFPN